MGSWLRITRQRWLILPLVALMLLLGVQPAAAHPLGNFTVNLYSRLEIGTERIDVIYVLDMAEIPTYQELAAFNGSLSGPEQERYLAQKAEDLRKGLHLLVDGQATPLALAAQELSVLPGQGGLSTLRIQLRLTSALPPLAENSQREIRYEDTNYAERIGWHEVVIQALPGLQLSSSDAPSRDLSNALRSYPEDMLDSPPDVRSAHAMLVPGGAGAQSGVPVALTTTSAGDPATDRFAALIATEIWTPQLLLLALLLSMGFGALHALAPGHGKTVVGAYLVGSRGTVRHALFLGLTVTITHTAGVFALGLVTLYASRYILPEQLYPWLSMVSGILVVFMGVTILRQRLLRLLATRQARAGRHVPHHDHSHEHDHSHGDHDHSHDHHDHHDHSHGHEHGPHTHTHLPPGADGGSVTWRSLLALGISGGLVPCPSALIVMLSAISLGRVGMGLLLIGAFSLGLAGVLTGIGVAFVYGTRLLSRVSAGGAVQRVLPAFSLLPLAGAVVVIGAGLLIAASAFGQIGMFR